MKRAAGWLFLGFCAASFLSASIGVLFEVTEMKIVGCIGICGIALFVTGLIVWERLRGEK